MNRIILKGRLATDPEMRQTPNGVSVCSFKVAVNRRFDREKADFIQCEAWRQTADFVKHYFGKGKEIALVGELHIDKVEKDGESRFYTKVVVDEVEFCGGKRDDIDVERDGEPAKPSTDFEEIVDDDDLPFA